MLNATKKAALVTAERSRYRKEIRVEREKVKALEQQLEVTEARAEKLEQERNDALKRAKSAERELEKLKKEEKRKMKVADAKGYQDGFKRARDEFKREARKMVNEELILKIPIAFRSGYKDGVANAAGVLQLKADMNLTKMIPAPVTPELVLPYTDEECAPLPPEIFEDSEDEGLEEGDADMAAEDGSGVKAVGGDVEAGAVDNAGAKAADAGAETAKDNQDAEGENIELD